MYPFFTVVTRHMLGRTNLLRANRKSLNQQTCQNWEQLLLVDPSHNGNGIVWANKNIAAHKEYIRGSYVLMLDDDDKLSNNLALEKIYNRLKQENWPELCVFKGNHLNNNIFPSVSVWKKQPIAGNIGSCDFVTKVETFKQHIDKFANRPGEFNFLMSFWNDVKIIWLDEILVEVQRVSGGRPD